MMTKTSLQKKSTGKINLIGPCNQTLPSYYAAWLELSLFPAEKGAGFSQWKALLREQEGPETAQVKSCLYAHS